MNKSSLLFSAYLFILGLFTGGKEGGAFYLNFKEDSGSLVDLDTVALSLYP